MRDFAVGIGVLSVVLSAVVALALGVDEYSFGGDGSPVSALLFGD